MFQYWVGAKIDPDASSEGVEVDLILGGDAAGPQRHRLLGRVSQ